MKQSTGILGFVILATSISFAQQRGGDPQERIDRMNEHMRTELALTDAQYEEIKPINEAFVYNLMELRGSEDREAMKDARDEYMDQLEGILTEEQMDRFKEMQKEHRHKMKGRKGEGKRQDRGQE
jgi:hypothetical protein